MATVVVSGRVDETVRQRADAALRKAGLTPTDVIQNVWSTIAQTGEVPDVAHPKSDKGNNRTAIEHLKGFLVNLPSVNPEYADLSDDAILALKVHDFA